MSRVSEVLERYREAEAAAREEVERLLAPAGLRVGEFRSDGDGWRLHLLPAGAQGSVPAEATGRGQAGESQGAARPAVPPAGSPTQGVPALVREGEESLMAMVGRAGDGLRVNREAGPGGFRVSPAAESERVTWLAGTLVGDTILALRHLGEPEDGTTALHELHRQLGLFRRESRRLTGSDDAEAFLAAVDRWTPAGFPRGAAFLARAEEVAHA